MFSRSAQFVYFFDNYACVFVYLHIFNWKKPHRPFYGCKFRTSIWYSSSLTMEPIWTKFFKYGFPKPRRGRISLILKYSLPDCLGTRNSISQSLRTRFLPSSSNLPFFPPTNSLLTCDNVLWYHKNWKQFRR